MTAAVVGLTPEQQAIRAKAVGASEVWDALFNPVPLWLRKTGREEAQDDSALSRLGLAIQPFIIGECARETGITNVHENPPTFHRGRMVAHLDAVGLWKGQDVDIEAKWRGSREGWGEPGTADVPQPILLQATAQMHVSGLQLALVPVLFLRPPVAVYEVRYDAELGEMIEAGVTRFWQHVEEDRPPDVNPDAPDALEILKKLYRGTTGERISAPPSLEHWRSVYMESAAKAKQYEVVADAAKAHCLAALGDGAELVFLDGSVLRRKLITRKAYQVAETSFYDARFVKAKE